MSMLSGATRSVITERYALLAPDGLVPSNVPGWQNAVCQIVIAPQMGARFTQMLCTLDPTSTGEGITDDDEWFVFVETGSISLRYRTVADLGEPHHVTLTAGGYAYLPPGTFYHVSDAHAATRLLTLERYYTPHESDDIELPDVVLGNEADVPATPFMGDDGAMLKLLLPDTPAFDMAVNIFTFQPGTTLPMVETHVMEHGLLMIQGGGIYRLNNDWHPVQHGDVIWMAAYCPQWFVATGKTPARYIYYKDVNRHPMHF